MKNSLLIVLLLAFINIYSQNDIKAKKLLDKVSSNIDKAKNYSIDFSYESNDNISEKTKGNILISQGNYVLDFLGVKQICDSNFIYTIVSENKEVMISEISEEKGEIINPLNLLEFYRDGYIVKIDESKNESNFLIQYVKLIPIDNSSDISHLLLGINTENNNIFKIIEIGKNKSNTIIRIDNITYNSKLSDDIFVFNKNDYKEFYIEKI
jgi:outer membrane lipoprotein-sorting protein|tara:strand:- start:93 stop:722 length:630 start_codon:yes stop_codon:yes gene_type:complete